jgi:hypothetical protein
MFMVLVSVETPLEPSAFMDIWIDRDDGSVRCEDAKAFKFVYYGPFEREGDAAEYARLVDGHVHELVLPVMA